MRAGLTSAADAQRSWLSAVAAVTGGSTFEVGGVACVHQPLPRPELHVPFPQAFPDGVIGRARELGAAAIGCWDPAPHLEERLGSELGFEPGWRPHWMALAHPRALALDPRITTPLDVPEFDDQGQRLLAMARTGASKLFVAREDGALAGFCWLHAGGLFDLYVQEPLRRRGLGRALTLAACSAAAAAGIPRVTLNAEPPAEPLYRSLGFETLAHGQTWWLHRP